MYHTSSTAKLEFLSPSRKIHTWVKTSAQLGLKITQQCPTLSEGIFPVTLSNVTLLQVAELQVVGWSMVLVVILPWCPQLDSVFHAHCMLHPHEIVIPWPIIRNLRYKTKISTPVRLTESITGWCRKMFNSKILLTI